MEIKEELKLIRVVLQELLDKYKEEKGELTRNQGALWKIVNSHTEEVNTIKRVMEEIQRALYGEEKSGHKGVVEIIKDLTKSFNDFTYEFKKEKIKRETTTRNINIIVSICTSATFLSIITFLYKIFNK